MASHPMPALATRGITKRFGATVANDAIDLDVLPGEIHAVMGENGAGKSTLMSLLYGMQRPDEGSIEVNGRRCRFRTPADAIRAGIGMVFQSFELFPSLTVAENVVFGNEPQRGGLRSGLLDTATAEQQVSELAERYGLDVDPAARLEGLPVGVRQRVEILKALYRQASVLILDEATAVLTHQEWLRLGDVMRALREDGRSILFVTHKLDEALTVSDRITVLRGGRIAGRFDTGSTVAEDIATAMTGRVVDLRMPRATIPPGEVVLAVADLMADSDSPGRGVEDVSFEVRAGEIVGIAGVAGNGQSELVEAVVGLRPSLAGRIEIAGTDVTDKSVAERRSVGLAHIPEDRNHTGTAPTASIAANMVLGHHRRRPLLRRGLLRPGEVRAFAERLVEEYAVRAASVRAPVNSLSGGNVQKVVAARELEHHAELLIAEQPTRGIDIGASEFIYRRIIDVRDRGGAVLLVSYELSELFNLASRILVMFRGRVVAEVDPRDTTEAEIGLLMAGRVDPVRKEAIQ